MSLNLWKLLNVYLLLLDNFLKQRITEIARVVFSLELKSILVIHFLSLIEDLHVSSAFLWFNIVLIVNHDDWNGACALINNRLKCFFVFKFLAMHWKIGVLNYQHKVHVRGWRDWCDLTSRGEILLILILQAITWMIWSERNKRVFEGLTSSLE